MGNEPETPLVLPPGHVLHSWKQRQVPAAGGIYAASMRGDLETLFGPVAGLHGREFLLEVDGEQWIATPTLDLFISHNDDQVTVFDTGGINARTNGETTTIDFELVRKFQPVTA
jgi:hypothetical protein